MATATDARHERRLRVRDAKEQDAERIGALAHEVWPATYRGLLEDDFIARVLEHTYSPDALRRAIAEARAAPEGHFLVAEEDGELVGYLHFGSGAFGRELHRLYVAPARTRDGIGGALLDELDARLAPGTSYVALVHAGNASARAFYRRRGYAEIGRVDARRLFLERSGLPAEETAETDWDVLVRYVVPGR